MKQKAAAVGILVLIGTGLLFFATRPDLSDSASAAEGVSSHLKEGQRAEIPPENNSKPAPLVLEEAPFALEFGQDSTSPERELELIQLAFGDYLSFVKEGYRRPIGNNRDFTRVLSGNNRLRLAPIPPDHGRINAEGELVDRNGIPFAIHPLAEGSIEVRAAGADRKLWTDDDLINVSPSGESLRKRLLQGQNAE